MPVACSKSVLTGQEGSIFFQPAGTQFCLLDNSDFPAGTSIEVGANHDFRVGDPVTFAEEGTATLDTALTAGDTYYVVKTTINSIEVSATDGGTAITLNGDGGTGTANTPGAANHIKIDYAEFASVCQVRQFTIEISRAELDTTTLPCGPSAAGSKFAPFRRTQSGYASGTGTMTVMFTDDQTSLANRLLSNTLLKSQEGAEVRLYVNTVDDGLGSIDEDASLYIESAISITSMSLSVNPDDPTTAELSYSVVEPRRIFGNVLA